MKNFYFATLLSLLIYACGSQRSELNFSNFNGTNAINSFTKTKVLPGLATEQAYDEYNIKIMPSLKGNYALFDSKGRMIDANLTQTDNQIEIDFSNRNQKFSDKGFYLLYSETNDKVGKKILLPEPDIKKVQALP